MTSSKKMAAIIASMLAGVAQPALAQDTQSPTPAPAEPQAAAEADDSPTGEIIVTGTRARLSTSPQAAKKQSIAMVTSVGTEELAKRTDVSVVAALERLPGVT